MDSKWISVSDQMPQEGVRCIIATRIPGRYVIDGEPKDGHEIEFGAWYGNRWKCFGMPCVSLMHPSMVSHWMPMPPNPVALSPTTMPFAPEEDPDEESGIWDSKKHKPD